MEKKTLSRRDFLHLTAAAAAGAALAGCAPASPEVQVVEKIIKETVVVEVEGEEQIIEVTKVVQVEVEVDAPTPVPEVVELVYFDVDESGAGEAGIAQYEAVAAKFSDMHPEIQVTHEPGTGGFVDQLIAGMAAGDAPDVFPHWINWGRKIMEAGQMMPLQEHFTSDILDDFMEEQLIAMSIGPSLFAMPKYISTNAMAYNKDLLDMAGVDTPDPDNWGWPEFFEAVRQTSEGLEGMESDLGALYGYWVNEEFIEHWVWQNGGEWMNKRMLGTKCLLDQPETVQALQLHYDMRWRDGWAATSAESEGLGWTTSFQTGRFAFHEPHSWMVSDLIRSNEFEWDFITLPEGPVTRAGMVFNDAWSIWVGSPHPNEAVEFLRYLTSAENELDMMLSVHGWLPSRKSLWEAYETQHLGATEGYNVSAFTKGLEYARQDPYFLENARVIEILEPIWEQIWITGDLELEEGLVLLTSQVNEFLSTVV